MRQSVQTQMHEVLSESVYIPGAQLRVSRVALGTWAMGGWMWGGTDERESVATVRAALDQGINLIDTAPVYGFGVSEQIVGKALGAAGLRSHAVIATKAGLEWRDGNVYRNATRDRIMREIDESLRRLRTDYIDIYQVHWPDPSHPLRRLPRRCASSTIGARFAPSASVISRWKRWNASAGLRHCTCCSHPTTSSNEPLKRKFFRTVARTTSRPSGMVRSVAGCSAAGCGQTPPSKAMICGASTQSFNRLVTSNTSEPLGSSIASRGLSSTDT
jgi:Aldo/keto reductase family